MSRPACLFLDTDVLIQLFLTDAQGILRTLNNKYGITAIVVPEVELEATYHNKFDARFDSPFRKACRGNWIQILGADNYRTIVDRNSCIKSIAVEISYAEIQRLGQHYNLRVDRGEAYTHASAVLLGQPAASNDFRAIQVLEQNGERLPSPVLRTFDLVALAYQIGDMDEAKCNQIRQTLMANNEYLPRPWQNASFRNGLENFTPRLVDSQSVSVGRNYIGCGSANYSAPMELTAI